MITTEGSTASGSRRNVVAGSAAERRDRSIRSSTSATIVTAGGLRADEAGRVDQRELGPAAPLLAGELVQQLDGTGVLVAGSGFDPTFGLHDVTDLPADLGAAHGERQAVDSG